MYKISGDLNLVGYLYSDTGGSIDYMKSTYIYYTVFGSSICSLLLKKQIVDAQPTAEAQYVSTPETTAQLFG